MMKTSHLTLFAVLLTCALVHTKVKLKQQSDQVGGTPSYFETESQEAKNLKEELIEEAMRDHSHLNAKEPSEAELKKHISYDGVVVKTDSIGYDHVTKNYDYVLIFIDEYDENCKIQSGCQRRKKLWETYKEMSVQLVNFKPSIAVLYMKCSDAHSFCNTKERADMVPFIAWVNHGKVLYWDFNIRGSTKDDILKFIRNEIRFSTVSLIQTKEDLSDFVSNQRFIRLLGVFPNETSNKQSYEDFFEDTIANSQISKSGSFIFAKANNLNLLHFKEIDSHTPCVLIISNNSENEEDLSLEENKPKELIRKVNFSPDILSANDTEKVALKERFIQELSLNSIPFVVSIESKYYQLSESLIDHQFLLVLKEDDPLNDKILLDYNKVSQEFRRHHYLVTFSFIIFNSLIKDTIGSKFHFDKFPVIFLHNLKKTIADNKFEDHSYKDEIVFKSLETFYIKILKESEIEGLNINKQDLSEDSNEATNVSEKQETEIYTRIQKVVHSNFNELVINSQENVLVFYHKDELDKNPSLKRWMLLLRSIQERVNQQSQTSLLKLYRFNTDKNSLNDIYNPEKSPQLVLFSKMKNKDPLDYPQGPSIKQIANFLELFIDDLSLNITKDDVDKYLNEIYSNPEYKEKTEDKAIDTKEKVISKDIDEEIFNFEHMNLEESDTKQDDGEVIHNPEVIYSEDTDSTENASITSGEENDKRKEVQQTQDNNSNPSDLKKLDL